MGWVRGQTGEQKKERKAKKSPPRVRRDQDWRTVAEP